MEKMKCNFDCCMCGDLFNGRKCADVRSNIVRYSHMFGYNKK